VSVPLISSPQSIAALDTALDVIASVLTKPPRRQAIGPITHVGAERECTNTI